MLELVWVNSFASDLDAAGVKRWPEAGTYGFNKDQIVWLEGTPCFLARKRGPWGLRAAA